MVKHLVQVSVSDMSLGSCHSLVLTTEGHVYSMGLGSLDWRLGHPERRNELFPRRIEAVRSEQMCWIHCGGRHSVAVNSEGVLWWWGMNLPEGTWGTPSPFIEMRHLWVRRVTCGHKNVIIVTRPRGTSGPHKDPYGDLRGKCQTCEECDEFFIGPTTLNSGSSFSCLICGCSHANHEKIFQKVTSPPVVRPPNVPTSLFSSNASLMLPPNSLQRLASVSFEEVETFPGIRFDDFKKWYLDQLEGTVQQLKDIVPPPVDRIFAMSDIHTDFKVNLAWLERLQKKGEHLRDAVIVAGDICDLSKTFAQTLLLLKQTFAQVFWCPGNHELWVRREGGRNSPSSVEKFYQLIQKCDQVGVRWLPGSVSVNGTPVVIFPMQSWYNSSFDTSGKAASVIEQGFDAACKWHPHMPPLDEYFLSLNEPFVKYLERINPPQVITFSHFVPRRELYRGRPDINKVVGAVAIDQQLRRAKSSIHIFGHTHMYIDSIVEGVWYVQNPLGNPSRPSSDETPYFFPRQIFPS